MASSCLRLLVVTLVCALSGSLFAATAPARPAPPLAPGAGGLRGMLILNEDNSHFFSSRPPEAMTREGLHALVDGYAGSAVTHLFLSPNSMRASFRSRTREAIWDPVNGVEPDHIWPRNARLLYSAGLDPYEIWIRRARQKGISPWLSMRMNDIHSVDDPDNFMHSEFWRRHPELRRVPEGPVQPWTNHALNYTYAAVREHQMAFVRELLERYDPDGLELDWMRFGFHLTPGREREEGEILTAFVREVRALTQEWAKRRGHPIRLGVRAPAHPDAAAGLGMDAVAWAREGLVDLIVPCPFWRTSDFDIPLELWRERLGAVAERVPVVPGFEHNLRAWLTGATVPNDLASLRGFAASMDQRGAESLYLFNWMDSQTRPVSAEDYAVLIRDGLTPKALKGLPRRHPVTYRDTVPRGFPDGTQLPVETKNGGTFHLQTGPVPATGKAWVVIGCADREGLAGTQFDVKLNGQSLSIAAEELGDVSNLAGVARAVRIACPLEMLHLGKNELVVRQRDGGPSQQIVWIEIRFE
jgi:hypothetical protein